ncbi:Down syndrome cell adhesion molecule-like protein, partial [Dinothrombium tinctorium]
LINCSSAHFQVPPKWVITPMDTDVIVGQDVVINCQASGYPQPRIWWEHAETLTSNAGPSHYQPVISNSHIHALENGSLIIKEISKNDEGYYLCQATNGVSSGISKVIKVTVHVPAFFKSSFSAQTVRKGASVEISCEAEGEKPLAILWKIPDKPETVIASQIESRRAVISWTIPYTGNSPIISYTVEYRTAKKTGLDLGNGGNGWLLETASGNANSVTLRKLKPLTSYEVRVKCENSLGWSEYSDLIHFTTDEEAPSGPPRNVHVYPLTSRTLQVTWKPPDFEEHNGLIKGYYLGYRVYGSTGPYVFKTYEPKPGENSDTIGTKINNLKRATKYGIMVQAFNSKGPGPQSEEIISETLANDPPPAPQLSVVSVDYTSVEISWNFEEAYMKAHEKDDLVINGYFLYYKSHHSVWEEKQIMGQVLSHTFHNLQCGTFHQFYVIAYNSIGKGDPSQVISAKTKGSAVPIAPSQQQFTSVNSTTVSLNMNSWKAIGCPITSFAIQYKPKTYNEWILLSTFIAPSQNYVEIADLTPGTWYSLLVIAHSDAGSTEAEYTFSTLTPNGGKG